MKQIIIKDKNEVDIENVSKIISITPSLVSLVLDYSKIEIKGKGLELKTIDQEKTHIVITGDIYETKFCDSNQKNKDSFFKKLFS